MPTVTLGPGAGGGGDEIGRSRDFSAWTEASKPKLRKTHTKAPRFGRKAGRAFRTALGGTQPLAYLEMITGISVLVVINLLFFREDPGFRDLNPNPLWLVVIAIAVRYGALPGYAVGVLSACVYLAFAALGTGLVPQENVFDLDVLLQPVLFLVAGGAIGELRESHKRAQKRLAAKYDDVEAGLQDVAQKYLASIELSRELERRISTQTSTVMTLYEAAKSLENVDVRQLSPSILELISSYIDAESCALYLLRDGKFLLEEALPSRADFDRPEELDTSKGMLAIAVGQGRTATVRDLKNEATPAKMAAQRLLMATPLLSEDGQVMGILVVEKMLFLRFTPAVVKLFTLLGDWASSAFQRALRFQQTRDRNVEDEITGAYNYLHVLKRLGEEMEKYRRFGVPLSLLVIGVEDYGEVPAVKLPGVLRTLSLVFGHNIRSYDFLGKYAADEGIFLLALPHATEEQARTVAERLEHEIEAFGFKPFEDERDLEVTTGLASASETVADAESLVEAALRDFRAANGAAE